MKQDASQTYPLDTNTGVHRRDFLRHLAIGSAATLSGVSLPAVEKFARADEVNIKTSLQAGEPFPILPCVTLSEALRQSDPEKPPEEPTLVNPIVSTRGKLVLVDFWATWCGPCCKDLPSLVEAYEEFKNSNFKDPVTGKLIGVGFEIVSVAVSQDAKELSEFLIKNKMREEDGCWGNHFLNDDVEKLKKQWYVSVLPTNYLINGAGMVVEGKSPISLKLRLEKYAVKK